MALVVTFCFKACWGRTQLIRYGLDRRGLGRVLFKMGSDETSEFSNPPNHLINGADVS
jgi:hypothetical protein